jgi:hypothetical protein
MAPNGQLAAPLAHFHAANGERELNVGTRRT